VGKTIIMRRKSSESIGDPIKPLLKRTNIVTSFQPKRKVVNTSVIWIATDDFKIVGY
jgi:dihydrofolate reductase